MGVWKVWQVLGILWQWDTTVYTNHHTGTTAWRKGLSWFRSQRTVKTVRVHQPQTLPTWYIIADVMKSTKVQTLGELRMRCTTN